MAAVRTMDGRRVRSARVFFAVWPDAPTARALQEVARAHQRDCGGRIMRPETLHVTLAFVGPVATERLGLLEKVARTVRAAPFDLSLDRLGHWRHNRILWAGGESVPLAALAGQLALGLRHEGFAFEARPFVPHLTLLRDAGCPELPVLAAPVRWPVREFLLVESRSVDGHVSYPPIGRWHLSN